jgi:GT2 family glycosyltransferase
MNENFGANLSLSVIIPNYNGQKLLEEFLPSVLKAVSTYQGKKEIIFVDDCSTDESFDLAKKIVGTKDFPVKFIKNETNGGYSKTCNNGAKNAENEILFFTNTDVYLSEDYFKTFSGYFKDDIFALCPSGYDYGDRRQIDGVKTMFWSFGMPKFTKNVLNDQIDFNSHKKIFSCGFQGAYFFVKSANFRELGGFDEIYSPFVMEETDLAYRALKRGWKIAYGPEFKGYHQVGSTIKSKVSKRTKIISFRNKLIFVWKNIHCKKMIGAHILMLLPRIICSCIRVKGFFFALSMLCDVRTRRKEEKTHTIISDTELFNHYKDYFEKIKKKV